MLAARLSMLALIISLSAFGLQESKPAKTGVSLPQFMPPKGYVCYRAAAPIKIDGKLDDAAWETAPWTDAFVDIEGDQKPKPRFHTAAKMLWDDQYFYIAARLEEPHIWGTLTEHDSVIFQDNDFEVFIDPDGDNHLYAEFEMNALNTTWDLLLSLPYKDGGRAIDSWEIKGLKTAVHAEGTLNDPHDTDKFWSLEIAIPWKVLVELLIKPGPPADGDQWRVNFSRVEWQHEIVHGKYRHVPKTKEDNWVWSPQGVVDMHRPEHWGYVQFAASPPGSATFRPDPTGSARHLLHSIYYAQRDYRKKTGFYAGSLHQLGWDPETVRAFPYSPTIETTRNTWTAHITVPAGADKVIRLNIRQDAKIWQE